MDNKGKFFLTLALIFLGLGFILIVQSLSFGNLRIFFCDVGQGDGMLIISPEGHEAVVDAGVGTKMVGCLSRFMPFWDRTLDLIVPTHAHQEHMEGFIEVLARYKVKSIMTTGIANNDAQFYKEWERAVEAEHANVYTLGMGDSVLLDPDKGSGSAKLEVLWPSQAYIETWKRKPPVDLNETSIVMRLTYGGFCAYLTGDLPKEFLQLLINRQCQLLKVVHHGSRTGTNERVLDAASPQIAVIQVGKNNRFGHPHKEVIDMLESKGVKILRNDLNGTIEIDTDGKSLTIRE